jgi:hypothetical protein
VESALLPDGHTICVGDVVWAQDGQHTSWPAKVCSLIISFISSVADPDHFDVDPGPDPAL